MVTQACLVPQVRVPRAGGRIIVASDGLWDAFPGPGHVMERARALPFNTAPDRLIDRALQFRGLADDITVIVVDLLPSGSASVPDLFVGKRGLFSCCAAPPAADLAAGPEDGLCVQHDEDTSQHPGRPSKASWEAAPRCCCCCCC